MRYLIMGATILVPAICLLGQQAPPELLANEQKGINLAVPATPEVALTAPSAAAVASGELKAVPEKNDVFNAAQQPDQKNGEPVSKKIPQNDELVSNAAQKTEAQSIIPQQNVEPVQSSAPTAQAPQPAAMLPEAPRMEQPEAIELGKVPERDVEKIDVEKGVGFDTLSLEEPEGNWLIKRIWWEKAEVRYEKIKNLVDSILDQRLVFFTQRNEVESKILDPFYIQNSITQGQLEEVILFLLDELKRERDQEKGLSVQERQLYETLLAEQRTLEQLRLDIEAIRKLDNALDDALNRLMEQINLCRNYEKQAWAAFKNIAKVLDHNKARSLYYSMDVYLSNIKSINAYIQNPFTTYFNSVVMTIKQNVERIKATMATLKEKGIDIRQQALQIGQEERALACKMPDVKPEKKHASTASAAHEEQVEEPQGWIAWIWFSITDFFANIWYLATSWWH